ncbi:MAG: GNAT family N-acetyltransferase, partial [Acidobacteria bacterium]|nr:GNAT family N-acetyltransferase [Acidobacteriota bacterium]
ELLEQREVENNLILGICNNLPDTTKEYEDYVFVNSIDDQGIRATSIKTTQNAVISGVANDRDHIKNLADFYLENNIDLPGAVGESFYSIAFSEFYGKRRKSEMSLIVHKLTSVNDLQLRSGRLETASTEDTDLIAEWTMNFEREADAPSNRSKEQIMDDTRLKIASGSVFKWVDRDQIVSIAAIVRRTRNLGIVGLVFTPDEARGKGYATSCVQKLSGHILESGFKYCGLFTDKLNPASNHIYRKIGYEPVTEFTAIRYEG